MNPIQLSVLGMGMLLLMSVYGGGIAEREGDLVWEGRTWVSAEYLKCMEVSLPCECMEVVEYPVLRVDRGQSVAWLMGHREGWEEFGFVINGQGRYEILVGPEKGRWLGVEERAGGLVLKGGGKEWRYMDYTDDVDSGEDHGLLGQLNAQLVYAAARKRGMELGERLAAQAEVVLDCNVEIGGINLLWAVGGCERTWILEGDSAGVNVYAYLNPCADKQVPVRVERRLMFQY